MKNSDPSFDDRPEASEADPWRWADRATVREVVIPVALLMVGVVVLTLSMVAIAANSQNRLANRADRHLAGSALRVETERVSDFTRDYAIWNDAAENLVVAPDETWAAGNIGLWANENLGMTASLVVDGAGRAIYASVDGVRVTADATARFSPELGWLVDAARAGIGPPGGAPEVETSYLLLDGKLMIAAAAAIKWEDARPPPRRDGAPVVLVFVRAVDAAMLERFGHLFLLSDVRLTGADETSTDSIALLTGQGATLARLSWSGARPGSDLVRELVVPIGGIVVLAAVLLVVIIHRARRSSLQLATSHRRLEAQARALEVSSDALRIALGEAARANAAKSDFLARMSHELRTPLNAILGFSEIIAMNFYGPAPDRYRECGGMIHEAGNHLRSLINDILDLSKIEAGGFELHEEDTDLASVIEQCIGLLAPKIEARGVTLAYRPSPVRMRADSRAMKQILLNLLSNAVKFTPADGRIGIDVVETALGIAITVWDTGVGMSPEDLEQVLRVFGQGPAGIAREGEGTGLGLNIAKALTEMHGGSLTLESELGRGTRATVAFPAARLIRSDAVPVPR